MEKYEVLKKYFGYTSFKEGQEELVDGILAGRDVLGIMPTGAGKSICYQVPALLLPGITLVISPLISLMKDIRRVFMHHGAEHKCINCIESGKSLTVKNIMKSSRMHKRCGTSFLLIVMVISIILFFFIRVDNVFLNENDFSDDGFESVSFKIEGNQKQQLLNDFNSQLCIFPQGIIRPPQYRPIEFQTGLTYIAENAVKKYGKVNKQENYI